MKLHAVEVLERERCGDHVLLRYRWTGEPPGPGQFVMVRAIDTAASSPGFDPFLPRPLFTHDYEGAVASLLFEVRGRGTALLAEEGSWLQVSAPLGRGYAISTGGPVALVGGGVWVSPLKLLSRHLKAAGIVPDVYLEIPASAPEGYAAWISKSYPDATLVPTDGALAAPRTVLDTLGDLGRYTSIYASGPSEMLAAVKETSTVPAQLALRERMACANGACYGCAVPVWEGEASAYVRACIEGPVFSAEALAW